MELISYSRERLRLERSLHSIGEVCLSPRQARIRYLLLMEKCGWHHERQLLLQHLSERRTRQLLRQLMQHPHWSKLFLLIEAAHHSELERRLGHDSTYNDRD